MSNPFNVFDPSEFFIFFWFLSSQKISSDISELHQTKSQLIWLLKQVITAENIRKEEAKKKTTVSDSSLPPTS